MKRYFAFAFTLMVILLAGCGNTSSAAETLSPDDESLTVSMRKYFEAEDNGYAMGKLFSAKILSCVKIKYNDPAFGPETIYKYEILIAPRLDQPMDKVQVKVFPTNGVYEHFEVLSKKGDSERAINLKQGFILEYPGLGIEHKRDLIAFKYDFYMSNFGDEAMQEAGIGEEEMDKGMTNLSLEVFCDGKTDIMPLSYGPNLEVVERPEDELALQDRSIYELVTQGRTSSVTFGEY